MQEVVPSEYAVQVRNVIRLVVYIVWIPWATLDHARYVRNWHSYLAWSTLTTVITCATVLTVRITDQLARLQFLAAEPLSTDMIL